MNPLILAAALSAIPVPYTAPPRPEARAEFTPAAADATRAVVYQLRVLSLTTDLPDGITLNAGATTLTDAQFRALTEAVQADVRGGCILQAPRVTTIEGQTARVFTGNTRTFTTGVEAGVKDGQVVVGAKTTTVDVGQGFELTGRTSANGKAVTTRLKFTDTRVGEVVPVVPVVVPPAGGEKEPRTIALEVPNIDTATVETTVVLPAGRHVVIPGPVRMLEFRQEFGPPVLSRIPYVNRLFTNVGIGRVAVRTFLVLSATVVEDDAPPVAPAPRAVGRR